MKGGEGRVSHPWSPGALACDAQQGPPPDAETCQREDSTNFKRRQIHTSPTHFLLTPFTPCPSVHWPATGNKGLALQPPCAETCEQEKLHFAHRQIHTV